MNPITWETLAILGTVAGISGGGAYWLSGRFRALERIMYRELGNHRLAIDNQIDDIQKRLFRAELKLFGFTHSGQALESSVPRSENPE